jgi:tetratricopeptide (TPR) repeat protein
LPDNSAKKAELQSTARDLFSQAGMIFQAEHDRQKAAYDKFDKFIPKGEKAKYEAREQAYVLFIQAQLHLAVLMYEMAQTWDSGSAENKEALTEAAGAFERIHSRYRQLIAGLYARMWQGKCFEELNDVTKALGIYNELLGHGGANPSKALSTLQDRVRHFRFCCLNHEERKDYQLVIDEAQEWLTANPDKEGTRTWLGIQWELARALRMNAETEGTSGDERVVLLRQALVAARTINRFAGEYKDGSSAMIQKLTDELDRKP